MRLRLIVTATAVAVAGFLTACGGGSDDNESAAEAAQKSPTGVYAGSSGSGSTLREFSVLVLDTGRFYSLYTGPAGTTPDYIAGVVVGDGSANGSNFTAATVRDFNFEDGEITEGSLSSAFVPKTSISGTVTAKTGGSIAFSGTYDTGYDLVPSLAKVTGTYTGDVVSSVGNETASLTIASNGSITGASSGGCNVTGNVATHSSGNVYDVSMTFGAGCVQPSGTTFTGHAYLDEATKELYTVVSNTATTDGVLFIGTKP